MSERDEPTFELLARERLLHIADAVMREGQVLYPYRASAAKNQYRWIFGVAMPPSYAATSGETDRLEGAMAVRPLGPVGETSVDAVVRFLQPRRRQLVDLDRVPADQLDIDGDLHVSFDGADLTEIDLRVSSERPVATVQHRASSETLEHALRDRTGQVQGFLIETRHEIALQITMALRTEDVSVAVENVSAGLHDDRISATRSAACGVHVLLQANGLQFGQGQPATGAGGLWPSLAGSPGETRHGLLTPMVLPDHAHLAPESGGELFDGLEIEEVLNLRLQTLAPAEQREVAATDPWAADALARAGALDAADLSRLHGAQRSRSLHERGSSVVLAPDGRTDTIDLAMTGRRATVRDIRSDQDGRVLVGVTVDDDPATDLHLARGRLFWFRESELARE